MKISYCPLVDVLGGLVYPVVSVDTPISLWAPNGRIFRFGHNGCRYGSRRPIAPPHRVQRHCTPVPNLAKAGCGAHQRHLGMSRVGRVPIHARFVVITLTQL